MTTPSSPQPAASPAPASRRNRMIGGIALILVGVLALVGQLADRIGFGMYLPLALGIVFLIWGSVTRTFGLVIPGGILGGIGLGVISVEGLFATMNDEAKGGIFLLCFAAGWALISLLSLVTSARWQWWPLIPGGILATIGGLLLAGPSGIQYLGVVWPIVIILVGLWLITRRTLKS